NYGEAPLATLLPQVIDAAGEGVGVLAAGGIATAEDARAALAAGASGVWVGTRFLATPEANAHPDYKAAVVAAAEGATELTGVFGPENPGFNPMRVLSNAVTAEWRGREAELPTDRAHMAPVGATMFGPQEVPVRPFDSFVPVPQTTGDVSAYPLLCGAGVGRIGALMPAGDVVRSLAG
ncbi:MAG: nitronate monooxygenase, partial [Pseudomonadota bacterium]